MHNWGNFIGLNLLIFPIETIFMKLQKACIEILEQLINLVQDLTQTEYCESLIILNGNTVGKHIRHVIEFYELLMNGYHTGKLNYDQRRHNEQLAQNPAGSSQVNPADRCSCQHRTQPEFATGSFLFGG